MKRYLYRHQISRLNLVLKYFRSYKLSQK